MQGKTIVALLIMLGTLLPMTARAAIDPPVRAVQQAQLVMFRSGIDLFVHRGEDRTARQAALVEADIKELQAAVAALQGQAQSAEAKVLFDALGPLLDRYVQRVHTGLEHDPMDTDFPWGFNFEFSNEQRELWAALEKLRLQLQAEQAVPLNADEELVISLPCKVLSLTSRYVARAYIGDVETYAETDQQLYVNQELDKLANAIDADLNTLAARIQDPQAKSKLARLQMRWKFIHGPLQDYSKDMAPLVVDRHARAVANELLQLQL